jgi:hypothetical protein
MHDFLVWNPISLLLVSYIAWILHKIAREEVEGHHHIHVKTNVEQLECSCNW